MSIGHCEEYCRTLLRAAGLSSVSCKPEDTLKSFPGKESHPPAETILAMVNMRKNVDRRALAHALIVSLYPIWASQIVYVEKSWPGFKILQKAMVLFCRMHLGEQGWRSGESTRLPPPWPGFDSRTRRHLWVEFVVGSLLCSERFFSGYSGFPLSAKTNVSKFQFDPECSSV